MVGDFGKNNVGYITYIVVNNKSPKANIIAPLRDSVQYSLVGCKDFHKIRSLNCLAPLRHHARNCM